VVVRDAATGELVRSGRASHPDATEVDPAAWWSALSTALAEAGGLDDVSALSVGAQQHGMVCLDADGTVVRPALLWNDTRSAGAAADLVAERGPAAWVRATGSVPVASFTVTKLRWLAEHEPASAQRTAAVALPHDWLTWRLTGSTDIAALTTDRSDASGTGYWSPVDNVYRPDLLAAAFGRVPVLPAVLGPTVEAGLVGGELVGAGLGGGRVRLGVGAGDNAAAALGLGATEGDVVVSIGTSGTVFGVSPVPAADETGAVAGFADATGRFLPLVCTLNAARVLDAAARMLGVDHDRLSELALQAPAGADGLVLVPYLEGERTPNRPHATGAVHGLRLSNSTPAHLARAAVEGMLCALADGLDAVLGQGMRMDRVILIGGGARSTAVQAIAPAIFGVPVVVAPSGEYVADGAARQAAWLLSGVPEPPQWTLGASTTREADPTPAVRDAYAEAREMVRDVPL
jgi:xylulokinase